jgi:hypothetical protein
MELAAPAVSIMNTGLPILAGHTCRMCVRFRAAAILDNSVILKTADSCLITLYRGVKCCRYGVGELCPEGRLARGS